MERKRIIVRRDVAGQAGLGLSIAGGIESTPFIDNDPGLFISKLVPNGAAEKAGLRVGDKVLDINGQSMIGRRHQVAVDCIQQKTDAVELLIQRQIRGEKQHPQLKQTTSSTSATSLHQIAPANTPSSIAAMAPPSSLTSTSVASNRPITPSQTTNTSFSSLPATSQPQQKLPYAADLAFGDPKLNGVIEEVDLVRDSKYSLGLSIVGGIDHCSHPFGSSAHPGVFISKITANSPAEISRRIRIGDRILRVNGLDISAAKHNEAVEALKRTGRSLHLEVCHEPQPKGLRSVVIHRLEQQPLGLSICGGIGSTPVNPDDRTDEGIFIERVEKGGPADQSCVGLSVGMRILDVNDDSLLGCTKEEAAQIFRRASPGPVRLLVCEGFSIGPSRPPMASISVSASSPIASKQTHQQQQQSEQKSPPSAVGVGLVNSPPPTNLLQNGDGNGHEYQNLRLSPPKNDGNHKVNGDSGQHQNVQIHTIPSPIAVSTTSPQEKNDQLGRIEQQAVGSVPLLLNRTPSIEHAGVTTFSNQPHSKNATINQNGGNATKIAPPVAPKPKLNMTSFPAKEKEDHQSDDLNNSTNFSARLQQFEQQQQKQQSTTSLIPPSKRPLLSNEDLAKLAEDDRMRQLKKGEIADGIGGNKTGGCAEKISPISPFGDRQSQPSFQHILNDSPIPCSKPVSSIRTKKAENRFLQQQQQNFSSPSTIDQLASEQQRRSEWRQARMASLEAESRRVGQLINDVSEISKNSLTEERQQAAVETGDGELTKK